jgi:hypothetical protein
MKLTRKKTFVCLALERKLRLDWEILLLELGAMLVPMARKLKWVLTFCPFQIES